MNTPKSHISNLLLLYRELWDQCKSLQKAHTYTSQAALETLSGFTNLTRLELPDASELNLGWDGGLYCGNASDGCDGRAYQLQVVKEGAETVDKAAAIVSQTLPRLIELSVGNNRAHLIRYENGTAQAASSQTGRMNEWSLEVVPKRDESDY
ncbi:hypothetical protein HD806DRAFT_527664 [Xylariaceae sp. AK1471]|nr:hypothetical protein HD806DRAFT_527664 [Xylariaceae sp. AK1471]